jgi:uncharacterized peroxidase-related enzyme
MAILHAIPEDEASGDVAHMYEEDIKDLGHVATHTKVMALNPAADRLFNALAGAIARPLGGRRYELVTLAAARALQSQHCLLGHGRRTLRYYDEPELVRIARNYRDAELSPAEVEMMAYAERLSTDAAAMTEADSVRLREAGFTDDEIVNITLAAALRNYYSRSIQALAVEVDVPEDLSAELREALLASAHAS